MGRLRKLKVENMFKANKRLLTESYVDDENVLYLLKSKFDKKPTEEEKIDFEDWVDEIDEVIDTDELYTRYFNDWLESKKMNYGEDNNYGDTV
jgi:hypothetical protein